MTLPSDPSLIDDAVLHALLEHSAAEPAEPHSDAILAAAWAQMQPQLEQARGGPRMRNEGLNEGRWRPFGAGIERKTLLRQGADVSVMLRMQPGAELPAHWHAADEHCIVVSGQLRLATSGITIDAGGFHWVAARTTHERIVAEVETVLYLRGALDEPHDAPHSGPRNAPQTA